MKKFDNFCKALSNLREGLQLEEPYSVVERTGIIGLFEICFEQAWKLMKAVLEEHGRTIDRVGSPKVVIQLAYQSGMIDDSEKWLSLLFLTANYTHIMPTFNKFVRHITQNFFCTAFRFNNCAKTH